MPKISVIVPVYRVEKYLRHCVDSILGQSFSDFELILIDDGSPDSCGDICEKYAESDTRVIVIHQKNGGLSCARNTGLDWVKKNSSSSWITFIDSDDWVHEEYLAYLYRTAIENHVRVSVCGFQRTEAWHEDVNLIGSTTRVCSPEWFWCKDQLNATIAWGKLYDRSLFDSIRYPHGKIHEDEFTTYKVLFQCDEIAYTPEILYYYRINPQSIIGKKWTTERLVVIEALNDQLVYFYTNNYVAAYKHSIDILLHCIQRNILEMKKTDGDYRKEIHLLKKQYKRYLYKFRDSYPVMDHYFEYAYAYPIEMFIYGYAVAIKNKVFRR